MSRWTESFQAHAVHQQLARAVDAAGSIDTSDPSILADAGEVARFQKVLAYLQQAIRSVDPELLPLSFWDPVRDHLSGCADQIVAFKGNKDIAYIKSANQYLDNALLHVRPYLLAKGRLGPALQSAAKAYAEALTDAAGKLKQASAETVTEIELKRKEYAEKSANVEAFGAGIRESYEVLIAGPDPVMPALMAKIRDIESFHRTLTIAEGESPSLKQQVALGVEAVNKDKKAVDSLRVAIAATVGSLEAFEGRMLGAAIADGTREGGLDHEINLRVQTLRDFEGQQKTRYSALNDQIESLLPGATSAGLATAYMQMRNSFSVPVRNANRIFYASVAGLVFVGLLMNVDRIWLWGISFQHPANWLSALQAFVHKLPLLGPLIWLAYYASKRRSEFQRLEQEYAHKQALAMSYESYRKQIQDLGSEDDALMKDLLAKAVEAIAFNASASLDGKHGDKIPIQELLEKTVAAALNEAKKAAVK